MAGNPRTRRHETWMGFAGFPPSCAASFGRKWRREKTGRTKRDMRPIAMDPNFGRRALLFSFTHALPSFYGVPRICTEFFFRLLTLSRMKPKCSQVLTNLGQTRTVKRRIKFGSDQLAVFFLVARLMDKMEELVRWKGETKRAKKTRSDRRRVLLAERGGHIWRLSFGLLLPHTCRRVALDVFSPFLFYSARLLDFLGSSQVAPRWPGRLVYWPGRVFPFDLISFVIIKSRRKSVHLEAFRVLAKFLLLFFFCSLRRNTVTRWVLSKFSQIRATGGKGRHKFLGVRCRRSMYRNRAMMAGDLPN